VRHYWFITHVIVCGVYLSLCWFAVPRLEAISSDFAIPLPELTIRVLQASHLAGVLSALILLLLVANWFVLDAPSRGGDGEATQCWSVLMLVVPLLAIALTLAALILPVFTIDCCLSG
jgi:hypothetical protein